MATREERMEALERHVAMLQRDAADAVEEARRAIGRLDRAAEYCRSLASRLEELEEWQRSHEGDVAGVSTRLKIAGGALIAGPLPPSAPLGTPT